MMELIKTWILQLTGAAMLSAIAVSLTPNGKVKNVVSMVCGLVMIIALISPAVRFDSSEFTKYLSELRGNTADISSELTEVNDNLNRTIIEEESEAYILDKGTELGMENMEISVFAQWSEEGYWYPSRIEISGTAAANQRQELSYYIESQFGIAEDMQIWSTEDEN